MKNIQLNGVAMRSPEDVLGATLSAMPNLKYWSEDALRALFTKGVELALDFCTEKEEYSVVKGADKANLTRFRSKACTILRFLPQAQGLLLQKVFDQILQSEGLALLHGFGLSNSFGDSLYGDPERQTIYN